MTAFGDYHNNDDDNDGGGNVGVIDREHPSRDWAAEEAEKVATEY